MNLAPRPSDLIPPTMRAVSNIYEAPEATSSEATTCEIGRAAAAVAASVLAAAFAGFRYLY
jgi:hypothetical protein